VDLHTFSWLGSCYLVRVRTVHKLLYETSATLVVFFAFTLQGAPNLSHPRLWLTTNDFPHLRGRATPSNPIYQQGLLSQLNTSLNVYRTQFFPGGIANTNYPDPGDTQGYTGELTESHALVFAFHSLIDPSPANRALYAQYARNLLMYAMNQAALGHLAGAPFRDALFATYNRANGQGEQWPLAVDWIYNALDTNGAPILSTQDKLTIRNVFLLWANDCLNASTTGGDHPSPIGITNSPSLLPQGSAYRVAANNYYLGHARLLTMMALCVDSGDDPPVNPAQPDSVLGNTLRSYLADATGAWLYQEFAMFGEPNAVINAYGLSATASVGLASGGLPAEGMLYGHSFSFLLGQLLALQTGGYNDPALSGPQIGLIGAPFWERSVAGFLSSLVPGAQVFPSAAYLGPVYQMASYGDLLRLWMTPDFMQAFALLALLDQQNGSTAHLDAARWWVINAVQGGAVNLNTRLTNPWSKTEPILYFMLLDPNAAAARDPRPALATTFYDAPQGRLLARTDWTTNATVFDFRGSWISINHQDADCGQFEFYRKGEWLTKELSAYDNSGNGQSSPWHNTLSLKNWCQAGTPNLNWFEGPLWTNGSQWQLGLNAGDPVTLASSGSGYAFAQTDMTRLYNRPSIWTPANAALDVLHASRSALWLGGDHIIIYDRASSLHAGLFKRFNLNFVTTPTINSKLITETTPGGQHLFVSSLLPSNPTFSLTLLVTNNIANIAELEPTTCRLSVEDTNNPTSIRFLHLLQGADAGVAPDPAIYVQSSSGNRFEGTAFQGSLVLFPVDLLSNNFTSLSYSLQPGITNQWITGLATNAGYSVSQQGALVTISPGGSSMSDQAGVLQLSAMDQTQIKILSGTWTNGEFHLTAIGPVHQSYTLETSADLLTWTPITTNTPAFSPFALDDTGPFFPGLRFYRLRSP